MAGLVISDGFDGGAVAALDRSDGLDGACLDRLELIHFFEG